MSGPKQVVADTPVSGWLMPPPVNQHEAETAYGAPLGEVWGDIEALFQKFGSLRDQLAQAGRLNKNRNDPRSFPQAVNSMSKSVSRALKELQAVEERREHFQLVSIASMGRPGGSLVGSEYGRLIRDAQEALSRAALLLQNCGDIRPLAADEADARRWIARSLCSCLKDAGHDVSLTTGFNEGMMPDAMSEADLTPFERLLSAFEIHDAETPSAMARWTRKALQP